MGLQFVQESLKRFDGKLADQLHDFSHTPDLINVCVHRKHTRAFLEELVNCPMGKLRGRAIGKSYVDAR